MSRQCRELCYPDPVVYKPKREHKATVFLLHGLGDTGHGWADVARLWASDLPDVKFVFPTAPTRPITRMGNQMTAWFDLLPRIGSERQEDKEGLQVSTKFLEGLVEAEIQKGIPSDSIAVAGFSQGGAVALMMLRSSIKISGIIGMSTFLPMRSEVPLFSQENSATPVLLCHGDCDSMIPDKDCKLAHSILEQAGLKVESKIYERMGHSAIHEELEDVKQFLAKNLNRS